MRVADSAMRIEEALGAALAENARLREQNAGLRGRLAESGGKVLQKNAQIDQLKDFVWSLQTRCRGLEQRLEAHESGSKEEELRRALGRALKDLDREKRGRRAEKLRMEREFSAMRGKLLDASEEREKELLAELEKERRSHQKTREKLGKEKERRKNAEKLARLRAKEKYKALQDLEKASSALEGLRRKVRMDHTNSSLPSSAELPTRKRKVVSNGRKASGRSQGAQPGHKGSGVPDLEATEPPVLLVPDEVLANPDMCEIVGIRGRRMLHELEVRAKNTPYVACVYEHVGTGERCWAEFPPNVHGKAGYGPGLKAAVLMLRHSCKMAGRDICEFLREVSDGAVRPSHGFVAGVAREFSRKSEPDRREVFDHLMLKDHMHSDGTVAAVNARRKRVTVNACEDAACFGFSEHKGHEALKGMPVENFLGTIVHDCEQTCFSYGTAHQICVAHLIRQAEDAALTGKGRRCHRRIQKMLRALNHWSHTWFDEDGAPVPDRFPTEEQIARVEAIYDRIIRDALAEYEDVPAPEYYKEGLNLVKRLAEHKASVLHCLRHPTVPTTNNLAERLLRGAIKRKMRQEVTARADDAVRHHCDYMTVVQTVRLRGQSVHKKVLEILSRP